MKSNNLAAVLAEKFGISLAEANDFIAAAFGIIDDNLVADDSSVKVKGLGTFKLLQTKERESIDINSGERILLSSRQKISFTPDSSMRDRVNAPFANFTSIPLEDDDAIKSTEQSVTYEDSELPEDSEKSMTIEESESDESSVMQETIEETESEETPEKPKAIEETVAEENPEKPKAIEETVAEENPEKPEAIEEDEIDEDTSSSKWWWFMLLAIVLGVAGGAGTYYFENNPIHFSTKAPTETAVIDTTVIKTTTDTTSVEKTDSVEIAKAEETQVSAPIVDEEHPFECDDPRVRLGAYIIIGTQKEVVVQEGQTFKGVCKAHLGPDMECYVQVYNGITSATVGDTIKIPKIKLKKR